MSTKFNTFRSQRYLRSRFVEGRFLLASEGTDLELELIDFTRTMVRKTLGDVAIGNGWKTNWISNSQLRISPGEAWFDGVPFFMRSGQDQLVSGTSLSLGSAPAGTSLTDNSTGLGKELILTPGTTPTGLYRIILGLSEELITSVEDPFLKNINVPETTGQKLRQTIKVNVVLDSLQKTQPVPYTGANTGNLVNYIDVIPQAGANGSEVSRTSISGSEGIDGRDLEIIIRNDPSATNTGYSGSPVGNTIPDTPTLQAEFTNGKLIDSNGNVFHLNLITNHTVTNQVVLRIDKEVGQPNAEPVITNGTPYRLVKRDFYYTDDTNGNPLGQLYFPISKFDWNTSGSIGVVNSSKITDLRNPISNQTSFQNDVNRKSNVILTGGGTVSYTSANLVTWTSALSFNQPQAAPSTVAATTNAMVDGGHLIYELNLDSGGAVQLGTIGISIGSGTTFNITAGITSTTIDTLKLGQVIKDTAGTIAYITAINSVSGTFPNITVSTALAAGSATLYQDSYANGYYKLTSKSFVAATRNGTKVYFAGGSLELEQGEESQIGDGITQDLLTFIGSTGETDNSPLYGSNNTVTNGQSLVAAITALDGATGSFNSDRNVKLIGGGTWFWSDAVSNTLTWSASAFLQYPGFADDRNTILAGSIVLNANEVAYVDINRTTNVTTNLTVAKSTIAAFTTTANRFIIARRDGSDVIIGTHSFRLKTGDRLELDGALSEINRLLGQLKLSAHPTATNSMNISGASTTLLDGALQKQQIGSFLLSFTGDTINFTTGTAGTYPILGLSAIGTSIPTSGHYRWFSVGLVANTVNSVNEMTPSILFTPASSTNATQGLAPLPNLVGTLKLGSVLVKNNAGVAQIIEVRRLGSGGGGGGTGTGNADSTLEIFKQMLMDSTYEFATPVVFSQSTSTLVDGASTGAYSIVDNEFVMQNSQTYVSTNLTDADFLNEQIDIANVQLAAVYDSAFIDPTATYEVSRNDGLTYETVTMAQVGETDTFVGTTDLSNTSNGPAILTQATTNGSTELNTTTSQKIADNFTIANNGTVLRAIDFFFTKTGSPSGNIFISIVKDNAGVPSTLAADFVYETSAIAISTLTTGLNTISLPRAVFNTGTYHIVVRTDATYQASFSTGVTSLAAQRDTTTGTYFIFNGTTWSSTAGQQKLTLYGYILRLRVRITASASGGPRKLKGVSLLYDTQTTGIIGGTKKRQVFYFNSTTNPTTFTLTNFYPDPDLLKVYLVEAGQVFTNTAFTLDGRNVVFPANSFDNGGVSANLTLVFDQTQGSSFDNSDLNGLLLASNRLGSTDANVDRSVAGRGILLRTPNGTLKEFALREQLVNGSITAQNQDDIFTNSSAGSFNITLPASPAFGDKVTISDGTFSWGTFPVTVLRNGSNINAVATDLNLNVAGNSVTLRYINSTQGWRVY